MSNNKILLPSATISLAKILACWKRERVLIVAGVLASLIVGLVLSLVLTPRYQAQLILENRVSGALKNVIDMGFQSLPQSRESAQREMELLTTQDLLAAVVQKENLDVVSRVSLSSLVRHPLEARRAKLVIAELLVPETLLGKKIILTKLNALHYQLQLADEKWVIKGETGTPLKFNTSAGPATITVKAMDGADGIKFNLKKLTQDAAVSKLRKQLNINRAALYTDLINIRLHDRDPNQAASSLNALAQVASERSEQRKQQEAAQALNYLKVEERKIAKDLNQTEQQLIELRAKLHSLAPEYENKILMSQLAAIDDKLNKVEQQKAILSQSVTVNHPDYVALNRLYQELLEQQRQIRNTIQTRPNTDDAISDLVRIIGVKTKLYQLINYQITQLNIIKNGAIGDLTIMQAARVPQHPSSLVPGLIILLSLLMGTALSLLLALVRTHLSNSLHSHQLEALFELPIYAKVNYGATTLTELNQSVEPLAQALMAQAKSGQPYWAFSALKPQAGLNLILRALLRRLSLRTKQILILEADEQPVFARQELKSQDLYGTEQAGVDSLVIREDSSWFSAEHSHDLTRLAAQYDLVILKIPVTARTFIELWQQLLPAKQLLVLDARHDTLAEINIYLNLLMTKNLKLDGFVVNKQFSND